MLFNTPTQFAVLALLLVIGWLFGLASRSGGKRWRKAYDAEVAGRARDREDIDGQLRQADARIAELERDKAALEARNAELTRGAPALTGAVAASAARPAFAPGPVPASAPAKRGWFDWGKADDLTALRGIDRDLERRLQAEKIDSYRELANLSDQDELALERRLDLPAGYIQREQLREQAQLLAAGDTARHAQRFG